MALTAKEIANAAAAAGFTGSDLQIAVAVAFAESSGNPTVVNSLGCVGLWQIYQSVWVGSNPTWTVAWLKIPANNAIAAYKVKSEQGWGAWSTYTSGAYKSNMTKAAAAIANRSGGDTGTTTTTSDADNAEVGPPSGAENNVSTTTLKNAATMSDFYLMGSKLKKNFRDNVTSASVEFTTDQVSQISITFMDPKFDILGSGLCKLGTPARLQNLNMSITSVSTDAAGGNPIVTINCQPQVVTALKNRQGALVMSNASPSDFVKAECKAVGANAYIQASPIRGSVSRDVVTPGQTYSPDQTPSDWTTFQRLAGELGYICFEENGTIYFGQPTYFTLRGKAIPVNIGYNTGSKRNRAMSIPQCAKSSNDVETTITVDLPLSRAFEVRCGRTAQLSGVPEFNGYYMISSVSYNLAGDTQLMSVTFETPVDPVAQPPEGSNVDVVGTLNSAGATSNGSWPVPKQYQVTTPYGVRGNWAAGFHTGADFACPTGTPVYAVYDGTIIAKNTWGADYGTHLILQVGATQYGYCHLSRITAGIGSQVKSGQVIGYSGATGNVTGPHLHLEDRTSPFKYNNKVHNPIPTLMKKGVASGTSSISSGKAGSKSASDFVYYAQSRAGGKYVFGAPRDPSNASETEFDCSSLVQWALYQVGITNFPGDTTTQTNYMNTKSGSQISVDQGISTRGALLYRLGGGGANDHVAISLGNGQTIEASSPSIGIGNQTAYGRAWTNAYLVPGLKY